MFGILINIILKNFLILYAQVIYRQFLTNKQAINIYQKLTEKLETLENKNEIR